MPRIRIYTMRGCPYCTRALDLLRSKNVVFEEIDVSDNNDLWTWLHDATGRDTVPQVFVEDRPLGGFSDLSELDRTGRLEALLGLRDRP